MVFKLAIHINLWKINPLLKIGTHMNKQASNDQKAKHIFIIDALNELNDLTNDLMNLKRRIENSPEEVADNLTANPTASLSKFLETSLLSFLETTHDDISEKIRNCRETICTINQLLF